MSQITDKINELLQKEWTEEDKKIITDLLSNIKYYKKFIPKTVIEDICRAIELCIKLKTERDNLTNKFLF